MIQIGPIKYNKDEEAILARSFFLGILIGIPLGIFVNYLYGFPTIHTQTPENFLGWTIMLLAFIMSLLIVPTIATAMFFILFLIRKERSNFLRYFTRAVWAVLTFFILLPVYIAVTSSAILVPFNSFLYPLFGEKWMLTLHALGGLVTVPFIILFIAIIGPDSKPGKALRRFIRRSKRRRKKVRE